MTVERFGRGDLDVKFVWGLGTPSAKIAAQATRSREATRRVLGMPASSKP